MCLTVAGKESDLKLESVDTSVDADLGTDVDKLVGKSSSSAENGSSVDEASPAQSTSESTEPDSTTSDSGPVTSEAQSLDSSSDTTTPDTKQAVDSLSNEATGVRYEPMSCFCRVPIILTQCYSSLDLRLGSHPKDPVRILSAHILV